MRRLSSRIFPVVASMRTILLFVLGSMLLSLWSLVSASSVISAPATAPSEVPVDELMKSGDLTDLSIGPSDAKVTIVEYASMTCGHCKNFHTKVFSDLKTNYIDKGKIRFIFREFPLDTRAFAASMLARCLADDKTMAMVSVLFDTQGDWAFVKENPTPKLLDVAKQAGFTEEAFNKCLTDQSLLDKLTAQRTRASEVFGVNSTPTFFINGKRLLEPPTLENFQKIVDPLLQ